MDSSAAARVMWTTPSSDRGVVSAAISSALSARRASPSHTFARCASASASASIVHGLQALVALQGAPEQDETGRLRQRLELENLRARGERAVDEEERIVRGGADQRDRAVLDVRQQNVLLGLVEAVDLVDEEDGFLAAGPAALPGGFEERPQDRHVGQHAAGPLEAAAGRPGDDLGERGFAAAGRAVEDDAAEAVGLDRAAQQLAGAEDVFLADDFLQRLRTHPRRERLLRDVGGACLILLEQVHKETPRAGKKIPHHESLGHYLCTLITKVGALSDGPCFSSGYRGNTKYPSGRRAPCSANVGSEILAQSRTRQGIFFAPSAYTRSGKSEPQMTKNKIRLSPGRRPQEPSRQNRITPLAPRDALNTQRPASRHADRLGRKHAQGFILRTSQDAGDQ